MDASSSQTDPHDSSTDSPLTAKQKRFVEEYLYDRNAVQSYFRAFGRRDANGNPKSYFGSAQEASKLLKNPQIRAEIDAGEKVRLDALAVNQQRIIDEYAAMAFADPTNVFEVVNGKVTAIAPTELPPPLRKLILEVKVTDKRDGTQRFTYKFAKRDMALQALCKHLGIKAGEDGLSGQLAELFNRIDDYKQRQLKQEVNPDAIREANPGATS